MNPLATYDYLALARRRILDQARPLGAGAYEREFPIGPGTLGRTLTHVMVSEWYYVQRLGRRDVPPYEAWPIRWEDPPPFAALEQAWARQAADTRAALGAVRDWSERIEYRVTADDGRALIASTTADGIFTQLVLHEVHHRAQAMNMLRHLGVPAEDLDFNALMYERREAP